MGDKTKESILRKLALREGIIEDCVGEKGHPLNYRNAANYWMNVSKKKPPKATNMELIHFPDKLDRETVFIALNSSLFYLYWMTYGDVHHVTKSQIMRFPMPHRETIEENKDAIEEYSGNLEASPRALQCGYVSSVQNGPRQTHDGRD